MTEKVAAQALHDRVILKMGEPEKQTKGGIVLPQQQNGLETKGTVLNVGDKVEYVKAGDVVIMTPVHGSAIEIKVDGESYVIVKETDILCILT